MQKLQDRILRFNDLPAEVTNTTFLSCRFRDVLPAFRHCQFHDCDFGGLAVGELISCKLWNCTLSGCDFTHADVRYSSTEPASPSYAVGARFAGVIAVNDCRWWAGLRVTSDDAFALTMLGIIVESPARESIYAAAPTSARRRIRALLGRPFRGIE